MSLEKVDLEQLLESELDALVLSPWLPADLRLDAYEELQRRGTTSADTSPRAPESGSDSPGVMRP